MESTHNNSVLTITGMVSDEKKIEQEAPKEAANRYENASDQGPDEERQRIGALSTAWRSRLRFLDYFLTLSRTANRISQQGCASFGPATLASIWNRQ